MTEAGCSCSPSVSVNTSPGLDPGAVTADHSLASGFVAHAVLDQLDGGGRVEGDGGHGLMGFGVV